ncbi:hypothetical protein PoB_002874000 [Plakobranchus ocellatus]|uniref:Uncharacterized protein n=1 Tax=Plakobranchus ocellatus TaxID=259542 RepID=A0AAV4A5X8_9GAST|nr:hypothetical protein PoB_002874000 [Plakobranchus ocellatus]
MLWVFVCAAVFNVNSYDHRGKDCKFCGKTHRNGTTFKYPPKSCEMYKCLNGEVKHQQPSNPFIAFFMSKQRYK